MLSARKLNIVRQFGLNVPEWLLINHCSINYWGFFLKMKLKTLIWHSSWGTQVINSPNHKIAWKSDTTPLTWQMIWKQVKQWHCRGRERRKGKGITLKGRIAWGACFVLSGIHMSLNSGWQSVWCIPIFHYQAAGPGRRALPVDERADWRPDGQMDGIVDECLAGALSVWEAI